jgi:peptidyl-prolyl cis-trans isomerase SurA
LLTSLLPRLLADAAGRFARQTGARPGAQGWLCLCLLAAVMTLGFSPAPARAQVVALVNGAAVTESDILQRIRLLQVTEGRTLSRKDALQELVDERVKIQMFRRYKLDITDEDVEQTISGMARRNNMTVDQLSQRLGQSGLRLGTLRERIRAEMGWGQIVRARFQSAAQVTEGEVIAATQSRNQSARYFEFRLRQITLIVPRGSNNDVYATRQREAERLRQSFTDCEAGEARVREMRETVIRPAIVRTSADFADRQRDILEKTPIGQLTPVEVTRQGVEMLAVCERKEIPGQHADTRDVRNELVMQRLQGQSQRWLEELRRQALIEYR